MGVFCQYRQALVSLFASSDAISIRSVLPELCGVTSLVKTRASIIITHKGRQAVAICLNDIKKQNMRQNNNYASLNVPKDFIRVVVMKIKLIDVGMEVWLCVAESAGHRSSRNS